MLCNQTCTSGMRQSPPALETEVGGHFGRVCLLALPSSDTPNVREEAASPSYSRSVCAPLLTSFCLSSPVHAFIWVPGAKLRCSGLTEPSPSLLDLHFLLLKQSSNISDIKESMAEFFHDKLLTCLTSLFIFLLVNSLSYIELGKTKHCNARAKRRLARSTRLRLLTFFC